MKDQFDLNLCKRFSITMLLLLFVGVEAKLFATPKSEELGGMYNAKINATAGLRDPFWPVGYKSKETAGKGQENKRTKAVEESTGNVDWKKAMKQVAIQGVSSRGGGEFFAVINGQVKGAGETVSVKLGGVTYQWMIDSVSPPSSVKLRRVSAR